MFYQDRPKITLDKSTFDNFLDVFAFGLLIVTIIYTVLNYSALPDQIPMHFNYSGDITRFDDKDMIWLFPILGIATVSGIFYLNKFPHVFNYPQKITPENAKEFYSDATRMLRFINVSISLLFSIILFEIVQVSLNNAKIISQAANYIIMSIVILMTIGPLIYAFLNLKKKKT
ncbi:DUF1648 domain-containing protein [Bizionia myxarmorum]|uniref:DUF1648 domain-containing protein n=1 Tax=Bizionia myxarmorum TaxID=291186 RepID=A0A5D0REC8_9FLAO|nr:DUF1648 domain-containing protein [Bizionia myxarmorum]TYB79683.1 DUF1648 domain-containing protein [Bizionia myxarmorum]